MDYIDIHTHMVARTTEDYQRLALTGCLAVSEPAFWGGFPRRSAAAFTSYFEQLTVFEPTRAHKYGLQHYSWLGLDPREGEDRSLAQELLAILPDFLDRPTVLGIGEIGLDRVTANELATLDDQVALAMEHQQLLHIHTPPLQAKYNGTRVIIDRLLAERRLTPGRVLISHVEEHTMSMVLDHGFWAAVILSPLTKVSPTRAADLVEIYGKERLCVASACDWTSSTPTAIPLFIQEMRRRGHPEELIRTIVDDNPRRFLSQSPHWHLTSTRGSATAPGSSVT